MNVDPELQRVPDVGAFGSDVPANGAVATHELKVWLRRRSNQSATRWRNTISKSYR